jgi:hypothetical protein
MRHFRRRIQKLEDADPAHKGLQFVSSDCPPEHDAELPIPKGDQVSHSMGNGRVMYLIRERTMYDEEWAAEYCHPETH